MEGTGIMPKLADLNALVPLKVTVRNTEVNVVYDLGSFTDELLDGVTSLSVDDALLKVVREWDVTDAPLTKEGLAKLNRPAKRRLWDAVWEDAFPNPAAGEESTTG